MMLVSICLMTAAACAPATSALAEEPILDDASFAHWRDYLAPSETEMCWRTIPWRETFQQAVRDSQIEGKPILLWAMNGHPLGCV